MATYSVNRQTLILVASFALCYLFAHILSEYSYMRINLSSSHNTYLKLYWKTANNPEYSEELSSQFRVNTRKKHYVLPFHASLSDIIELRLDTGNRKGIKFDLRSITFYSLGSSSINLDTKNSSARLKANTNIGELAVKRKQLSFVTTGPDPHFKLDIAGNTSKPVLLYRLAWAFLFWLLLLTFVRALPWFSTNCQFVPLALLIITCMTFAMATLSKPGSHPDEFTHIDCAAYYENHYSPPKVCSAESRHTYTRYGVTRLDKREMFYYIGGRYLELTGFLPLPDHLKLRYFNVSLFLILVFLSFHSLAFRLLSLPLLLTPQIWYLFSYFNSDAFSLFVVMLTGYQVFERDSVFRRLLRNEQSRKRFFWIAGLMLLVALQYWIKLNYLFYPLFLLILGVAWLVTNGKPSVPESFSSLLMVFILGTGLFLSWTFLRHYVNDFELGERVTQCQEITANYAYKPSTPPEKQHPGFRLKDKGVNLSELMTERDWFTRIFFTGLGAYGYTEYLNSIGHYKIVSASILLLLAYLSLSILFSKNLFQHYALLGALTMVVGLIFAAALNNWTTDLQPQGRYLAVIPPIIGVLLFLARKSLNEKSLFLFATIPFLLGLYSFVANGIVEIVSS